MWQVAIVAPDLAEWTIRPLLGALVELNIGYLERAPDTSLLYEAGVVYRAEAPRRERWLTIPEVLALGHGDCEDLAAYRCAELRVRGVVCWLAVRRQPSSSLYHITVEGPDGASEDPSALLGMR